jgi:adenylosuccinate lyase
MTHEEIDDAATEMAAKMIEMIKREGSNDIKDDYLVFVNALTKALAGTLHVHARFTSKDPIDSANLINQLVKALIIRMRRNQH